MALTIEGVINYLKNKADIYDWVDIRLNARGCRQVAEWLEELVELRKRFGND